MSLLRRLWNSFWQGVQELQQQQEQLAYDLRQALLLVLEGEDDLDDPG